MLEAWRWFGPDDPVTLQKIVQAGARGVVTSLHHVPTGSLWPEEDIARRKREIESHGLSWAVVESIPLHNDIKTGSGDFRRYIDNYKQSVTVGELAMPEGVVAITPEKTMIIHVQIAAEEEEAAPAEDAAAEGDAPAADGA